MGLTPSRLFCITTIGRLTIIRYRSEWQWGYGKVPGISHPFYWWNVGPFEIRWYEKGYPP